MKIVAHHVAKVNMLIRFWPMYLVTYK